MRYKVLNINVHEIKSKMSEIKDTYSTIVPIFLDFIDLRGEENSDILKTELDSVFSSIFIRFSSYINPELIKDLESGKRPNRNKILVYIMDLDNLTRDYPLVKPIIVNMYMDLLKLYVSYSMHKEKDKNYLIKIRDKYSDITETSLSELRKCFDKYNELEKRELVIAYLNFTEREYDTEYSEETINYYMKSEDPVSVAYTTAEYTDKLEFQCTADLNNLFLSYCVNDTLVNEVKISSMKELTHIFNTHTFEDFVDDDNYPGYSRYLQDETEFFKEESIVVPGDYIIAREILETIMGKEDGYYKVDIDDRTIYVLFSNNSIYMDAQIKRLAIFDLNVVPEYVPDNSIVKDIDYNELSLKDRFKNIEINPISQIEYQSVKHSTRLVGFHL